MKYWPCEKNYWASNTRTWPRPSITWRRCFKISANSSRRRRFPARPSRCKKKQLGDQHPDVAASLAELTRTLLLEEKYLLAETTARENLALCENRSPDDWDTFEVRCLLGGSLVGQNKYAEAEPLLLSGYSGMKQREAKIPVPDRRCFKLPLQYLVRLYEGTGKPEAAAKWKKEVAALSQ